MFGGILHVKRYAGMLKRIEKYSNQYDRRNDPRSKNFQSKQSQREVWVKVQAVEIDNMYAQTTCRIHLF